jgi:molybdopterin molybdotransferase
VDRLGRLHFWQIAVKPGRPLAFGRLGRAVFVGLPGNPVAAVICFLRFARPLLVALGGGRWPEPRAFLVPAGFVMKKKPGRREYLRARLVAGADGRTVAQRIEREGSGILTSLVEADGLVEVAEDTTRIEPGDLVEFVPFSEFGVPG